MIPQFFGSNFEHSIQENVDPERFLRVWNQGLLRELFLMSIGVLVEVLVTIKNSPD